MRRFVATARWVAFAAAFAALTALDARAQGTAEMIGRSVQIRVTVGKTATFKTEDRPGWKNNGTGFIATTSGSGVVPINVAITTVAGISYEDFTYEFTAQAGSAEHALMLTSGTLSKNGGRKTLSVTWDPAKDPGWAAVRVRVTGNNPDRFTFFVEGTVSTGKPVPMPPPPTILAAAAPRPAPAAPPPAPALCRSGTGYSGAHFAALTGDVRVRPDAQPEGWITAKHDTELCIEDHIKTDDESTAYLALADMSTFFLKPESEVVVVTPPERMSKIALVAGNIWTNIKRMVKDGSMEIDLNQAVTGIKGTTLALSTTRDASTVQVFEGTVEFRSKATGARALVRAGESMTATARGLSPVTRFDVARETAAWRALGAPFDGTSAPAMPTVDVNGSWAVAFDGGTRTTLDLRQSGRSVTGTLRAPDNSRGGVTGTVSADTLLLSRDTGLETVQRYRLLVNGDRFAGTYANEGRYPGQGAFDGIRTAPAAPSVTGTWNVTFAGATQTTLVLRQTGNRVTGTLRTPDNSRGEVSGTFDGTTLLLSRDTGLETIQRYRLTVSGDRFTGTFANEGKYPDSGTFAGVRTP